MTELAAPFAMSRRRSPSTSRCCERAGLITRGREAQWRPCRLEAAPLEEVAEWAEGYRRFWDGELPAPGRYLLDELKKEKQQA